MQEEKYIRLNIVIKPPIKVIEEIIKLSKSIADEYSHEFILDGKNFYPHITVYSPLYPKKNLKKVINKVGDFANNFRTIDLETKKIKEGQAYIGVEFEYTNDIKKFHELVVEKLNPLREGSYKPIYDAADYRMKISEEKKENIAKYGYPNAMTLYRPHMTIIRLKNEAEAKKVASEIDWKIKSFKADAIAVYKMGDHGTCIELVKEF
ncbi:DUF1045 domain-containing protein [Candidatus Parcubacteria bacterium]|nr:DUF1045 domain-containing protein [Candidatus Parcubacteria bacterium]